MELLGMLKGLASIKSVAAMFGLSVLGFLGVAVLVRSAVAETLDAVAKSKIFMEKYRALLTSPEALADYERLKFEWDEALEKAALVLDRIKQKSLADKLRKAIS
jgi:hypothetical protein